MPLNPAFSGLQVTSALNHLSASHFIVSTETNLPRKAPASNLPLLQHLQTDLRSTTLDSLAVPSLNAVVVVDNSSGRVNASGLKYTNSWEQLMGDNASARPIDQSNLRPDEVINIQFTSGTTSMPKVNMRCFRRVFFERCTSNSLAGCLPHSSIDPQQRETDWSNIFLVELSGVCKLTLLQDRMLLTHNDVICCPPPLYQ